MAATYIQKLQTHRATIFFSFFLYGDSALSFLPSIVPSPLKKRVVGISPETIRLFFFLLLLLPILGEFLLNKIWQEDTSRNNNSCFTCTVSVCVCEHDAVVPRIRVAMFSLFFFLFFRLEENARRLRIL